jgi:hypothetical protein
VVSVEATHPCAPAVVLAVGAFFVCAAEKFGRELLDPTVRLVPSESVLPGFSGTSRHRTFRGAAALSVPFLAGPNSVKLFSEKLLAIPRTECLSHFVHSAGLLSPFIEIDTNPDVHFDGPKMDKKGLAV